MKFFSSFFLFLLVSQLSFSQGPPPDFLDLVCGQNFNHLSSQEEVDSFPFYSPDISVIEGCLVISGDNITNVDSLYAINQINGSLFIGTLSNCIPPPCNFSMSDLTGLENLTQLNGGLYILGNLVLSNLEGLQNINSDSLTSVTILYSPALSMCAVEPICGYISMDSANVYIEDNAPGCNTAAEVEAACSALSVNELARHNFSVYPNPASSFINIETNGLSIFSLKMYNHLGQTMPVNMGNRIDVSAFPAGMYFIEIKTSEGIRREKVMVE